MHVQYAMSIARALSSVERPMILRVPIYFHPPLRLDPCRVSKGNERFKDTLHLHFS